MWRQGLTITRVVAADVRLDHQMKLPEESLFEHGAGEAVRGIAAVVLRGRQHCAGSCSGVDDRPARADGDPERLLADDVQPLVEGGNGDEVMDGRIGDDVERLDGAALDQLRVVGEDRRARPKSSSAKSAACSAAARARVADRLRA